MTSSININPQGGLQIEQVAHRSSHSVRSPGLLGAMQDRLHINAYRARSLQLDPPRSRARAYLSYNQAYNGKNDKKESIGHLRVSQSSCFLLRLFRALRAQITSAAQPSTRQRQLSVSPAAG